MLSLMREVSVGHIWAPNPLDMETVSLEWVLPWDGAGIYVILIFGPEAAVARIPLQLCME